MSEDIRKRAGIIYNVVETVILALSVGLICWTANTVIVQGKELSMMQTRVAVNTGRLDTIESRGSRGLETHVRDDDTRIEEIKRRMDKLEAAIITLQTTPSKLEAITVRLENLAQGQQRIESQMGDHLKSGR